MSRPQPLRAGPEDFPEEVRDRVRAMIAEGLPIKFEDVFAGYSYEEQCEQARLLGERVAERLKGESKQ